MPARRPAPQVPTWLLGAGGVAVLLAALELLSRLDILDARFFPPVSEMFSYLVARLGTGEFVGALWVTLSTWAIGLTVAAAVGVGLGVLFGMVPVVWRFASSTVEFLRPVPSVALIPVAILLFGTRTPSTLLLVIYASVWPILIQVIAGIGDVDPIMKDTASSYRFSRRARITRVVWPTALPYAVTGFRLSATAALILTITGELLITFEGIGGLFAKSSQGGDYVGMYAYVIVAGLIGVAINLVVRLLERIALFWHPSVRRESS